jgi:hypothetical protein
MYLSKSMFPSAADLPIYGGKWEGMRQKSGGVEACCKKFASMFKGIIKRIVYYLYFG